MAIKFDSLERFKALHDACVATLNSALVYKDSCNAAIIQCQQLHDEVAIKSEKQSLMIRAHKEQIAILSRSNTFLQEQIKKQRKKANRQKLFAVGGGVAGGFLIGALTILLVR